MKALNHDDDYKVHLVTVPKPEKADSGYLLVKMDSMTIHHGDHAYLRGAFKHMKVKASKHDVLGASGSGIVVDVGEGVSEEKYKGKKVAIYRSLKFSESVMGCWCEYGMFHPLQCVVLPDDSDLKAYSGSLVNVITAYAFIESILKVKGHKGVICTAGSSGTGICMLGVCMEKNIPIISIVRSEKSKERLEKLGAKNVLVSSDPDFEPNLKKLSNELKTTAVFDGVGGSLLSKVVVNIPSYSGVYVYGFLGGNDPLTISTKTILFLGLTLTYFGNFTSKTCSDPEELQAAEDDIEKFIHKDFFKVDFGKFFSLDQFKEAIEYKGPGKAVLKIE